MTAQVSAQACAALQGFTDLMAAFMVGCFGAGCCLGSFVGGAIGARHCLSTNTLCRVVIVGFLTSFVVFCSELHGALPSTGVGERPW